MAGWPPPSPPAPLPSLVPIFVPGPQQVCVLGLHLAKELCEVDEDGDSWLQVTRRLPILPTLFTTLEVSLRLKQNLHFTEAALHLLLTLARTQQVGGEPLGRKEPPGLCWAGLALPVILPEALVEVGGCRARFHLIPCLSRPGSHSSGWSRHHPEHLFAPPECVPAQQQWDGAGKCQWPVRLHRQWKSVPPAPLGPEVALLVAWMVRNPSRPTLTSNRSTHG